jgi:hypothetical protein
MKYIRLLRVSTIGSALLGACVDEGSHASRADAGPDNFDASHSTSTHTVSSLLDAASSEAQSSSLDAGESSRDDTAASDSGASTTQNDASDATVSRAPTYYQDVLPLLEHNCLGCHVQGGIGPFELNTYESAKDNAAAIQFATETRVMPPYLVTNDGSCGDFANAPYLSEDELQLIRDWVNAGTLEGTPRAAELPNLGDLPETLQVTSPNFTPVSGGGVLDEHDDYRCFVLDPPVVNKFITGYQVIPGNDAIVHHVVVNLVDMTAASGFPTGDGGNLTNGEAIAELDAQDPDVEGYKCFGLAGDGVDVESVPVVWAPGQGVVRYPNQAGIPVGPNHKLVVQIHYNLADESHHGDSDQTSIRFEAKEPRDVPNIGLYLPTDPLLDSLLSGGEPVVLPAGEAATKYVWERSFEELGLGGIPEFQLWGLFPHMHELGNKYSVELLRAGAGSECAARVNKWDFHWQHLYFYEEAQVVTPGDSVRVTCEYDTRSKSEPILPGWGTQNEMCFLGMFVTVPNQ